MTYGWAGTILDVDLNNRRVTKKPLDEVFALKWLGGEGFGARFLWENVGPEIEDGLDPRNVLIYAASPLTGTMTPGAGRLEIISKSPITGLFGDTNSGGHFAPELKQAGYDALIIRGKADKPVYIWIDDDRVEIRDAAHLWGRTIPETDRLLREEVKDENIQISCIGPAGEKLVRFAIMMNNIFRAPGWAGCGGVAGSKNLKAVAIRGTRGIRIARPAEFEKLAWQARQTVKDLKSYTTFRRMGTMYLMKAQYNRGVAMLRNFNESQCSDEYLEKVSGDHWAENYAVSTSGCHGCSLHCKHFATIRNGPYAGLATECSEFGTISPWTYWYGSGNVEFAMAAANYCNDYGMDATEAGMLMAWLADCMQRGVLTGKDASGLAVDWGDEKAALELMRLIVQREGIGDLLAEGLYRAARSFGPEAQKYAYTIKGKISVEGNPRGIYGCALATTTSTRGADHLKGWNWLEILSASPKMSERYFGSPHTSDSRTPLDKGKETIFVQHMCTLMDTVGACKHQSHPPLDGATAEDYARLVSAATGHEMSGDDMMATAERIWNQEKAFNIRAGARRHDDSLPKRYYEVPINKGPLDGFQIEKEKFEAMLSEYYELRGWDPESGFPRRATLERLGLQDVGSELEKAHLTGR
ncbi:MAG: aldehyde:ferredoxin oxidoreductase [Dehalococcoidia bacterium]|nr:aldehyde:ferredoxin oxidoreductase [Dehalococcoidia bacterium]